MVDDEYIPKWDCFAFERVHRDLIPEIVNFQIQNQSPYGVYDSKLIDLIVGCYLPKLSSAGRSKVWFSSHEQVWGELLLSRENLQRVAYHIDGDYLRHYMIKFEESYIEDEVHIDVGALPPLLF